MESTVMTEGKARLYKTAVFTDAAHANTPDLPFGPVRVQFYAIAFNAFFGVHEPVFSVFRTMDDKSFICHYFARALTNYVL